MDYTSRDLCICPNLLFSTCETQKDFLPRFIKASPTCLDNELSQLLWYLLMNCQLVSTSLHWDGLRNSSLDNFSHYKGHTNN